MEAAPGTSAFETAPARAVSTMPADFISASGWPLRPVEPAGVLKSPVTTNGTAMPGSTILITAIRFFTC